MDRRRIMLWGILVLSTIFTTYQLVFNRPQRGAPLPPATTGAPPPANAAAPPPVDPAAAAAAVATAAPAAGPAPPLASADLTMWRAGFTTAPRDPFFTAAEIEAMGRPPMELSAPEAPPVPLPAYVVKFVLMEGSEGRALIDNQLVEVGDRLGEERVVQVLPDGVVLERNGSRRRLTVAGSKPVQITLERNR